MNTSNILIVASCAVAIIIIGKIFLFPIKKILKLVFNSLIGGLLIYIINLIGASFGFHIGLNVLTSFFVGVLGIPGAILLMVLQIIM